MSNMNYLIDTLQDIAEGCNHASIDISDFVKAGVKVFTNESDFKRFSDKNNYRSSFKSTEIWVSSIIARLTKGQKFFTIENLHKVILASNDFFKPVREGINSAYVVNEEGYFQSRKEIENNMQAPDKNPCKEVFRESGHITSWDVSAVENKVKETEIKGEFIMKHVVSIVIMDNDEKLPLEDSIVYLAEDYHVVRSNPKNTEAVLNEVASQGELDMAEILDEHNKVRKNTVDENKTNTMGRNVYLMPVEWKDLTVKVTEI